LSEKKVLNDFTFVNTCASNPSYKHIFDSLHLVYGALILILGCYVARKSAALTTLFNEVSGAILFQCLRLSRWRPSGGKTVAFLRAYDTY
jgi:hypothetical protein